VSVTIFLYLCYEFASHRTRVSVVNVMIIGFGYFDHFLPKNNKCCNVLWYPCAKTQFGENLAKIWQKFGKNLAKKFGEKLGRQVRISCIPWKLSLNQHFVANFPPPWTRTRRWQKQFHDNNEWSKATPDRLYRFNYNAHLKMFNERSFIVTIMLKGFVW
jgi:hypothetical protein